MDALIHAHQGERNRIASRREYDGKMTLCLCELLHRQRHSVLVREPCRLIRLPAMPGRMVAAVERDQILVEHGELGSLWRCRPRSEKRRVGQECVSTCKSR